MVLRRSEKERKMETIKPFAKKYANEAPGLSHFVSAPRGPHGIR